MKSRDELELIISLIKKYNLPLSPILEYAINEKIGSIKDFEMSESFVSESSDSDTHISCYGNNLKDNFKKYLFDNKSQGTARNYLRIIDGHIRRYVSKLVAPNADSIYSFTTIEDVKSCIFKLKADNDFLQENAKWHNAFTASLSSYLHFIENTSLL